MSEPKTPKVTPPETETDEDTRAIVARRGRFVAAPVSPVRAAATKPACR